MSDDVLRDSDRASISYLLPSSFPEAVVCPAVSRSSTGAMEYQVLEVIGTPLSPAQLLRPRKPLEPSPRRCPSLGAAGDGALMVPAC